MTGENKDVVDRVLDVFVFAPLGLALNVRKLLPELAEKGRQQVTGQVTMARMIGQFAVQQGTAEAEKAFGRARTQAQATLEQLGVLGADGSNGTASSGPSARPTARPASPTRPKAAPAPRAIRLTSEGAAESGAPTVKVAPPPAPAASKPAPSVESLAIPDYDSLSASQVLPRLAGLSSEELVAVRDYEAAHRARKTILNKVGQLQASP